MQNMTGDSLNLDILHGKVNTTLKGGIKKLGKTSDNVLQVYKETL